MHIYIFRTAQALLFINRAWVDSASNGWQKKRTLPLQNQSATVRRKTPETTFLFLENWTPFDGITLKLAFNTSPSDAVEEDKLDMPTEGTTVLVY